ncbi:hypothetical protein [uncultured Nostoc sp.]|uniref:hypothetical protein n=1 Tax=uncultured Nostoc sp. TaxID=340711 RepID=UPI0035CB4302
MFLLQGYSKDCGQRWLLNRLASIIPNILEGKNIVIDLNRTSSRTDILAIWDEFAGRVGLPEKSLPSQIAEKICELRKSQNVLIAFNNADETQSIHRSFLSLVMTRKIYLTPFCDGVYFITSIFPAMNKLLKLSSIDSLILQMN